MDKSIQGYSVKYKELKQRVRVYQDMLANDKAKIYKLEKHIQMLNKQLEQQDIYINRLMDEIKVLKDMYRDDLINNFKSK